MSAGPVRTTCPYCGVGCGIFATARDDGTAAIEGDPDHPANFGRLCSKKPGLKAVDLFRAVGDGRVKAI